MANEVEENTTEQNPTTNNEKGAIQKGSAIQKNVLEKGKKLKKAADFTVKVIKTLLNHKVELIAACAIIGILLFIVLAAGAIYVLDDDTNEKTYTAKQNFDAGGVLERRNY